MPKWTERMGEFPSKLRFATPPWILSTLVFLICAWLRSPVVFLQPRLWAEEGAVYYADLQHLSLLRGLAFIANGNYQFATNVIVEVSLHVRTRDAAFPTTYLSGLVACLCCGLIARFMAARSCSRLSIALACGLFALQTSGYEVFLNATNVQWVCSAVTLFLFLSDDVPARSPAAGVRYLLVAALGMTGVTSCILLPLVGLATWARGTRTRWIMLAVLCIATAAQLAIVATHSAASARSFSLSADHLVPLAMQGVLGSFLHPLLLDSLGGLLEEHDRFTRAIAFELVLFGFAGLVVIAAAAVERLGRLEVTLLSTTIVFATLANEYGALGSVDDMATGAGASRYFFLASTCVIVMAAAGLDAGSAWRRGASALMMTLAVTNAVLTLVASPLGSIYFNGQPFAGQVQACAPGKPCSVYAWPDTGYDRFVIDANRLRDP